MGSSVGFGSAKCVGGWWVSIKVCLGQWNFHFGTCRSCKSCVVYVDVDVTKLKWCCHKLFSSIFLAIKQRLRKNLRLKKKKISIRKFEKYFFFFFPFRSSLGIFK